MNVVYLPLDSRPCSYEWPVKLAEWAGHNCIVPDQSQMDFFRTPASFESSRAFLLEQGRYADAFVISAEHLCFGSLLASRNHETSLDDALERLSFIKQLKALYPDKPVWLCGVIMRTSLSTLCAGDLEAYNNMTRFSYYSGKPGCEKQAEKYRKKLPAGILEKYFFVRKRNHAVNMECARLAKDGVAKALMLLQEDSEVYGFHKQEQAEFRSIDASNVYIHNGADEGGALAVMRALSRDGCECELNYTGLCHGFSALYEDRPFDENLQDSLKYAGVNIKRGAPNVLVVHTPYRGRQTEAANEDAVCDTRLDSVAERIRKLASGGKNVYLLDVAFANGGSGKLLKLLRDNGVLYAISGYSAWNTASNSLGSLLAQMLSDSMKGQINKSFLTERICDDLIYERYARQAAAERLKAEGQDVFALSDTVSACSIVNECFHEALAVNGFPEDLAAIHLVWPRLFEAGFDLNKKYAEGIK